MYTNGKIKGKIIWLYDETKIKDWYQIDEKKIEIKEDNEILTKFKNKYDLEEKNK